MGYNYCKEIYERNICDLEDEKRFKKILNDIKYIEKYFSEYTCMIDEIREIIFLSYNFNDRLSKENRINFIRGIIYSKHYVDDKDIDNFIEDLKLYNKQLEERNKTVFESVVTKEDEEMYTIDQIIDDEMNIDYLPDEVYEFNGNSVKNDISCATEDEISEEIYLSNYEVHLYPEERINYLVDHYEDYKEIILQKKKVYFEKEKKYIIKGMDAWFNKTISILQILYDNNEDYLKKHDKSLFKAL